MTSFWFSPREKYCLGFHFYFLNIQYNAGNMSWLTIFSILFSDLLASGIVTISTKRSLCSYLPTVLVPFCHTGFVSFHEINFFIYLQSSSGPYIWISY